MKTREEMIARYEELYNKMKSSHDVKNMKAFGETTTWFFKEMAKVHPDMAEKFLSHIECIEWDNYLSKEEATNISQRMINQDGSKGFHWSYETFVNTVEKLGGDMEYKPYYNCYALYVTANMIYSDISMSIAEDMGYKTAQEVPQEKMALSCYKKAVAYLRDKDNNFRIRKYFKHKMYDDSDM